MIAVLALQQHAAPPIMHSRSLNPYVASAFDGWRGSQQNVQPLVAKQVAAWPSAPHGMTGCSSFGMSGVNAHGIFSSADTQDRAEQQLAWQRQRHWPMPPHHHMLVAARWDRPQSTAKYIACLPLVLFVLGLGAAHNLMANHRLCAACRLQCSLAAADLAYLYDHLVQDTSILPGAGMLEMCTAR